MNKEKTIVDYIIEVDNESRRKGILLTPAQIEDEVENRAGRRPSVGAVCHARRKNAHRFIAIDTIKMAAKSSVSKESDPEIKKYLKLEPGRYIDKKGRVKSAKENEIVLNNEVDLKQYEHKLLSPDDMMIIMRVDPLYFQVASCWKKETPDGKLYMSLLVIPRKIAQVNLDELMDKKIQNLLRKDLWHREIMTSSAPHTNSTWILGLADFHLGLKEWKNDNYARLWKTLVNLRLKFEEAKKLNKLPEECIAIFAGDTLHSNINKKNRHARTHAGTDLGTWNFNEAEEVLDKYVHDLIAVCDFYGIKLKIKWTVGNHDLDNAIVNGKSLELLCKRYQPHVEIERIEGVGEIGWFEIGTVAVAYCHESIPVKRISLLFETYKNELKRNGNKNRAAKLELCAYITAHMHSYSRGETGSTKQFTLPTICPPCEWTQTKIFGDSSRHCRVLVINSESTCDDTIDTFSI